MKPLISLLLALALLVVPPVGAQSILQLGGSPPAAGATCPDDGSPSASNDGVTASATWGAGRQYFGQADWTDGGTPRTICKVAFKLTGVAGASSSTFTATIWTMSGSAPTYNLGTLQATSSGVTGVDAWNSTWVYFDFTTPFTTTANQKYAILVGPTVARASNDMTAYLDNTALTGYRDTFTTAGAADNAGGNDAAIRIYWQ